ncbi:MAG: hypothetical protein E7447_05320 [Ruminococcaceae bacterium]|nr:hypothetical protein [Oscillospiraceae bacterium]
MSASNKKKLRKEQNAAAMTQKQQQEQKEAKKLKAYTLTFAIVMILVVAIVVGVVVTPMIEGAVYRGTTAMTIGDHTLSTTDLTYFYMDAISEHQQNVYNQYYNSFGNYWSIMLGFDTTKALNAQNYDEKGEKTWADHFIGTAIDTAKDTYALYDDAKAKGYKLSDSEQKELDSYFDNLDIYATYYGYSSVESWLRNRYGVGANESTYKEYYEVCTLASSYLTKYAEDLKYDPEDYRAYEKDKFDDYSTVGYVYYTMKYNSYLGEGTKSEDGKTTTWTDEEKAAAREAMKADMEALLAAGVVDKESFDKAIAAWEINKTEEDKKDETDKDESTDSENKDETNKDETNKDETNKDESDKNNSSSSSSSSTKKVPTSTEVKYAFFEYITIHAEALEWMKEADRKAGDLKAFEVYTYAEHEDKDHEHGTEDCKCDKTTDGYTIVLYTGRNDHQYKMVNVRHILVKFEGGKTVNNEKVYSDEEKAKAKAEAEDLLQQWKDGKANEESFGELANKESDDQNGKVTNGGLYEDIYMGQMVEAFEEWCFAEGRKAGDTGIVETEYGYHVMYFSSFDEMTYRDVMIENDMRVEDTEKWHDGLVEKQTSEVVNLGQMKYDLVLEG